jgi:hypothetical protein
MPRRDDPYVLAPCASDALVFFLLWVTYAYFFQGGFSNQNSRFDLSMALAFEHRFRIDTFHENTIDKVLVGGHYFTEKAPLVSYLALPVPLVASLFWTTDDVLRSTRLGNGLLYASTAASVSLLSAAAGVLLRRVLLVLNPRLLSGAASALALVTFAGTLALPYSTILFGHQIAAAWLTAALYFALTSDSRPGRASSCFFLLGLAVITEYPVLPAAAAVALVALARRRYAWKGVLARALFAAIPLALLAAHNTACFGHPWRLGYGSLQGTPFAAGMSRGVYGVGWPSLPIAGELLFGTYRGLFVYSPVLALGVLALPSWPAALRRDVALPLLAGCLAMVLLISGYSFWQGGTCFGPRHLVAAIPLLAACGAYVPVPWLRAPWAGGLALASAGVAVLGTALTPFVIEQELAPLTRAYLPLALRGNLSLTPLDFTTPFRETSMRFAYGARFGDASFNVGEVFGLHGWSSLLPLAACWCVGIALLARAARARDGDSVRAAPEEAAPLPLQS